MSPVVVDTDVASFLFKGHSAAALYGPDLEERTLLISFMTLAELERWPIQAGWGEVRRRNLADHLRKFSVLPWNRALCQLWAEVTTSAQASGFRIDCADAWIAATALMYKVPLVTHNRDDYRGVRSLNVICHR